MDVLSVLAADFFDRVARIGVTAAGGFVKVVCTRTEGGAQIVGLILQIGPDVVAGPTRTHITDMTLAFQFELKEVNLKPADFLKELIDGILVTPLGRYSLCRVNTDVSSYGGRIDDAAALGQQQRWISFDVHSISDPPTEDEAVNWKLRAQPEPYDGLQDLQGSFGVWGLELQVRVVMSLLAAIDGGSTIDGEKATIRVRLAEGLKPDEFRLGYRVVLRDGVTTRASLHGSAFQWSKSADFSYQVGVASLQIPKAAALQCFAVYAERAFHYWWIGDPKSPHNVRRALLQLYDENLDRTAGALMRGPRRGKSKTLEAAVAYLLWMGGFAPIHLGENGPTDAPDVIGITPAGNVLVVECTTGGLKTDSKLQNLLDRTLELQEQLKVSDVGHLRVLAMIVTTRPRAEVELELSDFEKRGILIATQESLQDALTRTVAAHDADDRFREFEQATVEAKQRHALELKDLS